MNFIYALNMVFPMKDYRSGDIQKLIGKNGLDRIMTHKEVLVNSVNIVYNYEYTPQIKKDFGDIFQPDLISKYSKKIKTICDHVESTEGIILIYSQYIAGGLIPMALALESMGYSRYGTKYNLLKQNKSNNSEKKYVLITGDNRYSLNNELYLKTLTNEKRSSYF